jgi:hypothetical protein
MYAYEAVAFEGLLAVLLLNALHSLFLVLEQSLRELICFLFHILFTYSSSLISTVP